MRLWTAHTIKGSKWRIISWKTHELHLQQDVLPFFSLTLRRKLSGVFLGLNKNKKTWQLNKTLHLIIQYSGWSHFYRLYLMTHCLKCCANKAHPAVKVFGGNQTSVGRWDNDAASVDKLLIRANNRNSHCRKHNRSTSTPYLDWIPRCCFGFCHFFVDFMDTFNFPPPDRRM